jgi:hypothetical protein
VLGAESAAVRRTRSPRPAALDATAVSVMPASAAIAKSRDTCTRHCRINFGSSLVGGVTEGVAFGHPSLPVQMAPRVAIA